MIKQFKLISKKQLTYNVFELVFSAHDILNFKAWEFITFILDNIGWRAYSILKCNWNKITLIIKKREIIEGWRWGSKYICEMEVGDILKWIWPAWNFILKENSNDKLFIWTWTWFVPLYSMINYWLDKLDCNFFFLFWVRKTEDLFYLDELIKLSEKYINFNFQIYISREKDLLDIELKYNNMCINSWYTTNYLVSDNVKKYKEVYICWAHDMINSTLEKLSKIWFLEKNIFFEKY